MIYYTKEAVELLHLISEQKKGIPIITVFDIEAQSYKYGEKAYCNIIKKQITDAFEFTAMYADRELNLSFDDYVNLYILDPDSKAELKILNELLEYLQNYTIEVEQLDAQPIKKIEAKNNSFTGLQWSTIFYYVAPDLYGEIQQKKDKLEKFRKDFNVSNSQSNLSNKHSEIVRVVNGDEGNELRQHHINTINAILPFLENNNLEAFENAKDDLSILKNELDRK